MSCRSVRLLALLVLAGTSVSARAAGDRGTLGVRVEVEVTCTVTSSAIDFGTYVSGQRDPLLAEGSIGYADCPASDLLIELDGGQGGTTKTRMMADAGADRIAYELYKDEARKTVWRAAKAGQTVSLADRGSGTVPVYGSIPGRQFVPAGVYVDTVNITLSF
jgi:spore coat protein U-like protein